MSSPECHASDQAVVWQPMLQLKLTVGHLVSLDFLMSCDIPREDATLLLDTGVAFLAVAKNDQGERVLIARFPAFWTIYSQVSRGLERHWLTTLPGGAHTFFSLMRLGLPPTASQFVLGVKDIATGSNGLALETTPMDRTLRWGGIGGPSILALRSALAGHVILKTNSAVGKRVWIKLKVLYARLSRVDDQLLAELSGYGVKWHHTICCYLLLNSRPLRERRLRAIRDEPLAGAAVLDMFENRDNIGREILQAVDQRAPVRRLVQAYVGCTRESLRYINRTIGSRFAALTTAELDCLLTAAVLQPIARPKSIAELKSVITELNQIREIEHLLKGVWQLAHVNRVDATTVPDLDILTFNCRMQGGRFIAKKLKALQSANAVLEAPSKKRDARTWQYAGVAIRRVAMYCPVECQMPEGLDLNRLANLSLTNWCQFADELARAWIGNVNTLGVYATCHSRVASKVWGSINQVHQDGQPQLDSAVFTGLPHGVIARQVLGPQTKEVGLELANCLFSLTAHFDQKLRQGCSLLVRFEDCHDVSVAEFRIEPKGEVAVQQHSGHRGKAPPDSHTEAAGALVRRLHLLYFDTSVMSQAILAMQKLMGDVTEESQGNVFRLAELMHLARKYRVVNPPDFRVSQLEDDYDKYTQRI